VPFPHQSIRDVERHAEDTYGNKPNTHISQHCRQCSRKHRNTFAVSDTSTIVTGIATWKAWYSHATNEHFTTN